MSADDKDRIPEAPGQGSGTGGENTDKPEGTGEQPLGPATPDDRRPLGDTPEAHDEITPHDLPAGHPGRHAAERQAEELGGTTPGHRDGAATDTSGEPEADLVDAEEQRDGARVRQRSERGRA
jgi:hypothetical protein